MTQPLAPTGTVHWLGTGLSTGSGLRLLVKQAPRVVMWGRTPQRAQQCLDRVGVPSGVPTRAYGLDAVAGELRAGDVLVSMLPAAEHPGLAGLCVERGAHFACSSYVSDAVRALEPAARDAGVVLLAEAGLDPGIDHLFADLLVARARAAVGDGAATVEFTSYCGGLPAVPNEFRYRFSWAPRGVLSALLAPARYIDGGSTVVVQRPWEATRRHQLGGETFEVYPNRDSVPYLAQYGVPGGWRPQVFVRGTLRLDGWLAAWSGVFDELRGGDPGRIAALADELAARYPTTEADRDRVVLSVALRVRCDGDAAWSGAYLLDETGDAAESAMARCVSLPLAFGVSEILAGRLPAGLRLAAAGAADAQRWLSFLADNSVRHRFTETA
jgi:hypothetical protein